MTKTKEEMAKEYSHRFDKGNKFNTTNSGGAYFEELAFLAGYDARQAEVDELKSFIENVLLQTNKMTVQTLEIDKSWFYKNECIDLAKTIKNLRDEIQELKKDKERLDFMLSQFAMVQRFQDGTCRLWAAAGSMTYETPREAIDAAMKESKDGK